MRVAILKAKDTQPTAHNPREDRKQEKIKRDIPGSLWEGEVDKISLVTCHPEGMGGMVGKWGEEKGNREGNMRNQED